MARPLEDWNECTGELEGVDGLITPGGSQLSDPCSSSSEAGGVELKVPAWVPFSCQALALATLPLVKTYWLQYNCIGLGTWLDAFTDLLHNTDPRRASIT